jgi:hypothetical protein
MKKHLSIVLFGIAAISLTGCYTQVVVEENDDNYTYSDPTPIIIIEPTPPILIIHPIIGGPHPHPPKKPVEPPYKIRKPIKRPHTGDLRRPGKTRNPVTPPKRDDFRNPGKIREPVTPPSKDRIKEDNRNPGGKNQDGRKSRR